MPVRSGVLPASSPMMGWYCERGPKLTRSISFKRTTVGLSIALDPPLQEVGDQRPRQLGVVRLEAVVVRMTEAVIGVRERVPLDGLPVGHEALPERSLDGRR